MQKPEPRETLSQPSFNPSNMNFKLKQLALLSALGTTGTLRAAAERVNVSQPGATRLLHELEDMLGVTLFDRVKGKMVVTPAGEMMIGHANSLQSSMLLAARDTHEASKGNAGRIRIGIFGAMDPDMLSRCLLRLQDELPRVQLSLNEAPQELLIGALRRFEIDAAVGRLLQTDDSPDMHFDMLYKESFSVVCGMGNALGRLDRAVELADLIQCRWVLAPQNSALRQRIDAHFIATLGERPRGSIETRSTLAHLALLSASDHIAVLSAGVARFLEKQGQVRVLIPSLGGIDGVVTFITLAGATMRPSVQLVRDTMRQGAETQADLAA
ncbi:LysR family transcriptional regulator [soil metagenome]